jgi:predicted O-methyltransferase YrrM
MSPDFQPWPELSLPPGDGSSTDHPSLLVLGTLAFYVKPKLIVEAGTYRGHFPLLMHYLCPTAIIWTADPAVKFTPEAPEIHMYAGDFMAMMEKHVAKGSVDFAFIDSGPETNPANRIHHYEGVKPYMRSGGLVVTHDTNNTGWPGGPTIVAEGIRLQGERGLTLWQAP